VEFEYDSPFAIDKRPFPKRHFMPSKWERIKINKLVQGIKLGRIKIKKEED